LASDRRDLILSIFDLAYLLSDRRSETTIVVIEKVEKQAAYRLNYDYIIKNYCYWPQWINIKQVFDFGQGLIVLQLLSLVQVSDFGHYFAIGTSRQLASPPPGEHVENTGRHCCLLV